MRAFALGLPAAAEDFPWGEAVVKVERTGVPSPAWRRGLVHGPMFLWLGPADAEPAAVAVKLTTSHDRAVAVGGARPTRASGLGQWGWLTVPLDGGAGVGLVCEWVEESYRNVAPKRLVAELDARR